MKNNSNKDIDPIVDKLLQADSNRMVYMPDHEHVMPSTDIMAKIVNKLREVFFPGFYGNSAMHSGTISYFIGVNLDQIFRMLNVQIQRGICFECRAVNESECNKCSEEASGITRRFLEALPTLRHKLSTDVKATYEGDPAARSFGEIIFSYPTIRAMTNYRIAHELYKLKVPLIPRIITEMAHSETGIDIHPAAKIGEYFTIDHGTGVVIGETCTIGNHVKIYQGVTLGARSFPSDENGNPIKGIKRHPDVEDNVIIYSNATVLGAITIGAGSMIGGNIWVTNDIAAGSKVVQRRPGSGLFNGGTGI